MQPSPLSLEHFHHSQKKPICSQFPPFPICWQPLICFLSLQIYLFCINEIIRYMPFFFSLPGFFHLQNVFKICLCCMNQYFVPFFWPNNIPLYGYTAVCLYVHLWWIFELFPLLALISNAIE